MSSDTVEPSEALCRTTLVFDDPIVIWEERGRFRGRSARAVLVPKGKRFDSFIYGEVQE